MAKSRQDKINNYNERIAQLENQRRQEQQRLKADERKARTKRLCSRHGLLESMLPEIITITDEQYKSFLERAVANGYGRDILAKITAQPKPTATAKTTETPPQANANTNARPTQITQHNTTADPAKSGGGATVEG